MLETKSLNYKNYLHLSFFIFFLSLILPCATFFLVEESFEIESLAFALVPVVGDLIYFICYLASLKWYRVLIHKRMFYLFFVKTLYFLALGLSLYYNQDEKIVFNLNYFQINLVMLCLFMLITICLNLHFRDFFKFIKVLNKKYSLIRESTMPLPLKKEYTNKILGYAKSFDLKKLKEFHLNSDEDIDSLIKSVYKAKIIKNFFNKIFIKIVTAVTLGLAFPYIKLKTYGYETDFTTLDGYKLTFTRPRIFKTWVKWLLLSIITIGIYGLFVFKKFKDLEAKNTHIEGLKEKGDGKYDGSSIVLLCLSLFTIIFNICTLFLLVPLTSTLKQRYIIKHTYYDGYQLAFNGTFFNLAKKWLLWEFLTIITVGIYSLISSSNMKKWEVSHTHLDFKLKEYEGMVLKNKQLDKTLKEGL